MTLTWVAVRGLHGSIDYEARLDTPARMTLLHAPNGYGKTTFLRLIDGLANNNWPVLVDTHFKSLAVATADGLSLQVYRKRSIDEPRSQDDPKSEHWARRMRERRTGRHYLEFTSGERKWRVKPGVDTSIRWEPREWRSALHAIGLERVGVDAWRDLATGAVWTMNEAVSEYGREAVGGLEPGVRLDDDLLHLLERLKVRFIEAQRLNPARVAPKEAARTSSKGANEHPASLATIERYSRDLGARVGRVTQQHSQLSGQLDQEFPQRLLQGDHPRHSVDEVVEHYERQYELQQRLSATGLLQEERLSNLSELIRDQGDVAKRDVLSLFLDHSLQRLGVFQALLEPVELFLALVNGKLHGKRLSIRPPRMNRDARVGPQRHGAFLITTEDGRHLPLSALSSGEQHEVVLLYDLIFRVPEGATVLIDEPELSLHVTWQEQFLDDLVAIQAQRGLTYLVATHSPFIVGERDDLLSGMTEQSPAERSGSDDSEDALDEDEDWAEPDADAPVFFAHEL